MSGKFALVFGITDYTDPALAKLAAPGRDAEDLARVLKDQAICGFDDVRVALNALSSSAIEAIDEFFDGRKPDDLLVLYFSGHGIRDEMGSLYLAFRNTLRTRLRSTALKAEYIREAMDESRSKRQVLVLDCCNSGAFPPGTKAELGLGSTMGMAAALQGYGRYVLTASDATQFAWEGDRIIGQTDKSLFTHFLVKGLEGEADRDGDGTISVDDLYDYAFGQVSSVTPNQTPTKSASKQEGEIVLRQITRLEDIRPISLPDELVEAIADSRTYVREGAVQQLRLLLEGRNRGLARSARDALEKMCLEDDSLRVRKAATEALAPIVAAEQETAARAEPQMVPDDRSRIVVVKVDQAAQKDVEGQRLAEANGRQKREQADAGRKSGAWLDALKKQRAVNQKRDREQALPAASAAGEHTSPHWRIAAWTTLAFVISAILPIDYVSDQLAAALLYGGVAGFLVALSLRLERILASWLSLLWITLGWAAGWEITGLYYQHLSDNGWSGSFDGGIVLFQAISGCVAAIATGLVLYGRRAGSHRNLLLWLALAWALAGAMDGLLFQLLNLYVFEPAGIDWRVAFCSGSAIDGAIIGIATVWLLRREQMRSNTS